MSASSVKIIRPYQRGLVERLGRYHATVEPGLRIIVPFVDRLVRVDMRESVVEVPPQEVITSDNVTVKVSAVIFFQVLDARAAITRVFNFVMATSQIAQTTLRAVLGQSSLDELLSGRDKINQTLKTIIDQQTEPWGIKVSAVEVKDAELAPTMVRALARQAEAEREKRQDHRHRGRVPGRPDPGERRPGHLHPAGRPGASLHADAAGHGLEPELHHRLPDPDRADQAAAGGARAHGGAAARRGAPTDQPAGAGRSGWTMSRSIGGRLWERLRGWLPTPQDPGPSAGPLPTPWRPAPDPRPRRAPSRWPQGTPG